MGLRSRGNHELAGAVQWQALRLMLGAGLGKTLAVAVLVAPLATLSYLLQRRLVFR